MVNRLLINNKCVKYIFIDNKRHLLGIYWHFYEKVNQLAIEREK